MKLFHLVLRMLSLGVGFIFLSCSSGPAQKDSSSITIFYNNDNMSYLDTCGCRVSPIGGMDRRWNGFMKVPQNRRFFVDAGNLFFKSAETTDYLREQWKVQAMALVEAYNYLNADAFTPGVSDFALGLPFLSEAQKEAEFTFLSSNLVDAKNGKYLFLRSKIFERQGKKIGVFALFHPTLQLPLGINAIDPEMVALDMVKELQEKKVDMILLLSHQGYEHDVALAKKVKGIHLIVGANSQSLLQNQEWESGTLIVQLSSQGQMLGSVEYSLEEFPKHVIGFNVSELNGSFDLNPSTRANPMKDLMARTNLKIQEVNKKRDETSQTAAGNDHPGFETFLSCRDCHQTQAAAQEKTLHAVSFLTLYTKQKDSNLDCIKCHSVGLGQPGGFQGADGRFLDAMGNSVSLHKIMGDFQPKGDYRNHPERISADAQKWIAALKKNHVKSAFAGVQCENCHGANPGHPFGSDKKFMPIASETCRTCHTKEQMPSWYIADEFKEDQWKKDVARMGCPKTVP